MRDLLLKESSTVAAEKDEYPWRGESLYCPGRAMSSDDVKEERGWPATVSASLCDQSVLDGRVEEKDVCERRSDDRDGGCLER